MDYEPGDPDHPDPQKRLRPDSIDDFDEQDWLIIIEALAKWSTNELLDSMGTNAVGTPRGARAQELSAVIAGEQLDVEGQLVLERGEFDDRAIDDRWPLSQLNDRD
jgi:hypothetical protein